VPSPAPIEFTTREYVWASRRGNFKHWLIGGGDYSRAVEYPLAARLAQLAPGGRLLDVGAGRRAEFAELMARRGAKVTAIDAREDVGADADRSLSIDFRRCDARELPLEDQSFDAITAISTIEHIPEGDDRAMAELGRVLAPGGRLVVSVPSNPLKSADVFLREEEVYGRRDDRGRDRVFFEHVYDDDELEERIIKPTGLPVVERIRLSEPGVRMSYLYYSPRGPLRKIRYMLPVGPLFGLTAPRFLRPVAPDEFEPDDWNGAATVLVFTRR
jgi:ubiquinone/menaquinone biosynthesis C-methylase UbiE